MNHDLKLALGFLHEELIRSNHSLTAIQFNTLATRSYTERILALLEARLPGPDSVANVVARLEGATAPPDVDMGETR